MGLRQPAVLRLHRQPRRYAHRAGLGWAATLHDDDQADALDNWQAALRGGMPWQIECRLRGADGDYRWFRMECAPQRDAAGEILAWVGIATIDVQNVEGEACSVTLLLPSVPLAPSPATRRAPFHTEELGVTLDSCD